MPSFHDRIGVIDAIVLAVLKSIGLPRVSAQNGIRTDDEAASANAHTLMRHFNNRKIALIKEIRSVFDFGLRDAKEAMEAIYAAYPLPVPTVSVDFTEDELQVVTAVLGNIGGRYNGVYNHDVDVVAGQAYTKANHALTEPRKYAVDGTVSTSLKDWNNAW